MSEEYQRLQEAASAVEREIRELEQNHSISSAAELAALERRLDLLAVKRSSLSKAFEWGHPSVMVCASGCAGVVYVWPSRHTLAR